MHHEAKKAPHKAGPNYNINSCQTHSKGTWCMLICPSINNRHFELFILNNNKYVPLAHKLNKHIQKSKQMKKRLRGLNRVRFRQHKKLGKVLQ